MTNDELLPSSAEEEGITVNQIKTKGACVFAVAITQQA